MTIVRQHRETERQRERAVYCSRALEKGEPKTEE